jgi:poly-beta-1,6-N-acetyl-D-glucosamine synthase
MVSGEVKGRSYALVTAAYNEENYITGTLESIAAQTVKPKKWVIVNDGSSDRTEEIVQRYAEQYKFIELCRIVEEHPRNLTAQVNAINKGFSRLMERDYDFIGNLDADVSLGPTYFDELLERFSRDPQLGLAGGYIHEEENGHFKARRSNNIASVAHAVQLFRRECLESLGGYKPFSWAGADWHAEVSLRMKGWNVQSFPELRADHHRPTGTAFGRLRYWYWAGVMDFYMGTHPLFELFRVARRCQEKPYFLGALVRLVAFGYAYCRGEKRQVSDEFVEFLRKEQMGRLGLCRSSLSARRKKER